MLPIPPKPLAGNLHKRHRAESEDPASGKRETQRIAEQHAKPDLPRLPGNRHFRLLECLPTRRTEEMLEWLSEKDMLLLMQTSQKYRQTVLDFYNKRMKPTRLFEPTGQPELPYPDSIKWRIIRSSLQIEPATWTDGAMHWARYTAKLQPLWQAPVRACLVNSSERLSRPRNGPEWEIEELQKNISGSEVTYSATLVPTGSKANHPAYLYRNPMNRFDRYIPTDRTGLDYLAKKKSMTH